MKTVIILMWLMMCTTLAFSALTYEIEDMASDDVCDVVLFNYYLGYTTGEKYQSEKCVEVMGFIASLVVQNIKDMEDEALRSKGINNIKQNQKVLEKSLLAGCKKSRTSAVNDIRLYLSTNSESICRALQK